MEKNNLQGVNCQHQEWEEYAVAIWEDHHRPIWEGKKIANNSTYFKSALKFYLKETFFNLQL